MTKRIRALRCLFLTHEPNIALGCLMILGTMREVPSHAGIRSLRPCLWIRFADPADAAPLAKTFKNAKTDRIEDILETLASLD